jgi:hypothetical protein
MLLLRAAADVPILEQHRPDCRRFRDKAPPAAVRIH